eukprot:3354272-Prymnesium_polylepis.1
MTAFEDMGQQSCYRRGVRCVVRRTRGACLPVWWNLSRRLIVKAWAFFMLSRCEVKAERCLVPAP